MMRGGSLCSEPPRFFIASALKFRPESVKETGKSRQATWRLSRKDVTS